jgi:hypothetical protein
MILRVPGNALLLRVAWIERHDFRTKRTEGSVSFENGSAETFSFRRCRNLSKKAQVEIVPSIRCGENEDESANSSKDSSPS